MRGLALFLSVSFGGGLLAQAGRPHYASLGNFKLDHGERIEHCRLAYRTRGRLNRGRTNAILFPTWFTGTSRQLLSLAGPNAQSMLDTRKWFVIFVDALGDGVSSSPSNSRLQPRLRFPRFSLRDMVRAEYRLARHRLHLRHLHAVIGISMGGMQAFQWAVSYPGYMKEVIPIVGSPRPDAYDLLQLRVFIQMIREDRHWHHGNYATPPQLYDLWDFMALHLTSPGHLARSVPRESFARFLRRSEHPQPEFDANDLLYQAQAIQRLDVARPYRDSLSAAAARVTARMLIVPSRQDHMVSPLPAERFARLVHAQTFLLTSDCGHIANGCQADQLNPLIRRFLTKY